MTKNKELKLQMEKAKLAFIQPKNYIALFDLGDKSLNGNPTILFSAIYNRLGSSVQNGSDYFDKKMGEFYVIYEYSELAELINASTKTVSRMMDKLVAAGLIFKKKCFNGVYRLFPSLPDSAKEKFLGLNEETPDTPEVTPENTDTTPTDKKSPTKWTDFRFNYLNLNYLISFTNKAINTPEPINFDTQSIDGYADTLINNVSVPEDAVNTVKSLCSNNYDRMHNIMSQMFNAKKSVYNNASRQGLDYALWGTMFEENKFIQIGLNATMQRAVRKAYREIEDQTGRNKFMFTCFKSFFEESLINYHQFGTPENKPQYN